MLDQLLRKTSRLRRHRRARPDAPEPGRRPVADDLRADFLRSRLPRGPAVERHHHVRRRRGHGEPRPGRTGQAAPGQARHPREDQGLPARLEGGEGVRHQPRGGPARDHDVRDAPRRHRVRELHHVRPAGGRARAQEIQHRDAHRRARRTGDEGARSRPPLQFRRLSQHRAADRRHVPGGQAGHPHDEVARPGSREAPGRLAEPGQGEGADGRPRQRVLRLGQRDPRGGAPALQAGDPRRRAHVRQGQRPGSAGDPARRAADQGRGRAADPRRQGKQAVRRRGAHHDRQWFLPSGKTVEKERIGEKGRRRAARKWARKKKDTGGGTVSR